MKKVIQFVVLFFAAILVFSCTKNEGDTKPLDPKPECITINSQFNNLYAGLLASTTNPIYQNLITYDSEIHSYTFEVSSNQTICSVGYQSQLAIANIPYVIEIFDVSANQIIYSGSHIFSATSTSFVTLNIPVNLAATRSYIIKRIQSNYAPISISSTIGRVATNVTGAPLSLPFSNGILKITGTKLYQNAAVVTNQYLPYIDIVFK